VLATLQKLLRLEMTIAEWIGTAILAAAAYLVIGVMWSATHTAHLGGLTGIDRTVSILGSVVSWPELLFSDVCLA
jgi:predicted RND superfamily exporter protein